MVVASIWSNAWLVVTGILALWSLSWLIRGSMTNIGEREAEVEARDRVAQGGAWEEGGVPPRVLTDDEIHALADAQKPSTLEEAGVDATRRDEPLSRRQRNRTR